MAHTTEPSDIAAARRARALALSDAARGLRDLAVRYEAEADALLDDDYIQELADTGDDQ